MSPWSSVRCLSTPASSKCLSNPQHIQSSVQEDRPNSSEIIQLIWVSKGLRAKHCLMQWRPTMVIDQLLRQPPTEKETSFFMPKRVARTKRDHDRCGWSSFCWSKKPFEVYRVDQSCLHGVLLLPDLFGDKYWSPKRHKIVSCTNGRERSTSARNGRPV